MHIHSHTHTHIHTLTQRVKLLEQQVYLLRRDRNIRVAKHIDMYAGFESVFAGLEGIESKHESTELSESKEDAPETATPTHAPTNAPAHNTASVVGVQAVPWIPPAPPAPVAQAARIDDGEGELAAVRDSYTVLDAARKLQQPVCVVCSAV
jgi:hypothetical protein